MKTKITVSLFLLLLAGCTPVVRQQLMQKHFEWEVLEKYSEPDYRLHVALKGKVVTGYMLVIPYGKSNETLLMVDNTGKLLKGYFIYSYDDKRPPVEMYRSNWDKPVTLLQDRSNIGKQIHHFLTNRQLLSQPPD